MQHTILRHLAIVAIAIAPLAASPVHAQADSSYTVGPLWYITGITVEDGQFENYMDWLSKQYKKIREFGIKEGVELSHHVLSNNAKRAGEPDLYLVIKSKDHMPIAQQLAYEAKLNALMATDRRAGEAAGAKRAPMRKLMGNMELQELILK